MHAVFCLYMIDFSIRKCGAHWLAAYMSCCLQQGDQMAAWSVCLLQQLPYFIGFMTSQIILPSITLFVLRVSIKMPTLSTLSCQRHLLLNWKNNTNWTPKMCLLIIFLIFKDKNSELGAFCTITLDLGRAPVCSAAMDAVSMATLCSRSKILGRWFGPHP